MEPKTALVLSAGGMFGAWQAGAWRVLARSLDPDLVVGASVGALNGYVIASGWSPDDLCSWWLRSPVDSIQHGFRDLPEMTRSLVAARPLEKQFAVVMVNALRMRPHTVSSPALDARHLLASCAVPGIVAPQHIDGSWYIDGGVLNPLPLWAAAELGATRVVAMNVLAEMPSKILKPLVKGFRAIFAQHTPAAGAAQTVTLIPRQPLGSVRDALQWKQDNIERWIEQGSRDALAALPALERTFHL